MPGPGRVQQTESKWSELIAMLELAHRWQELIGEFTDESAHYDGAATDDLCSAFGVLAALELRPVGHSYPR